MKEKIRKFFQSPVLSTTISKAILGIGVLVLALAIFFVGEEVGYKRAQFSYHFGENYMRIFGGRGGMMGGMPPLDDSAFPNVHGATGKIVSVSLPSMVIANVNGIEKVVVINNDSLIRRLGDIATSSDLKVGDTVTVLGSPNENGWIVAKLVRVLPAQSTGTPTTK